MTPIAIGGDDGDGDRVGRHVPGLYEFGARPLRLPPTRASSRSQPARRCSSPATTAAPRPTPSKTIEVESAWSLAGGELTIDYRVTDAHGKRDSRAVWSVGETTLTLKSGAPPKELAKAAGQE